MNTRFFALAIVAGIAVMLTPAWTRADGEPVKLAVMARFDISADAEAGALEDGRVVAGKRDHRPDGLDSRGRAGTRDTPLAFRSRTSAGVRSRSDSRPPGAVPSRLTLMGPYDEASKGVIYRQEILWDDVRVEGASLEGGGFETPQGELAVRLAERRRQSVVRQTADVPAVEGSQYARTWHNQTLWTTIEVTAGTPVTVSVNARSVRPAGLREMKRIAEPIDARAHRRPPIPPRGQSRATIWKCRPARTGALTTPRKTFD